MRCGCGRELLTDLTGMEQRCGGCQGPAARCQCPRLNAWDPDSEHAELIEVMCSQGTASDIIEACEETRCPEWYVRQVMRDHDWADEAIADVCLDAFGTKPEDEAIRPDDERIVSAPSTAGGQVGPAASADDHKERKTMTTNAAKSQNENYGPVDFMGIDLYNPQAKAMARELNRQHAEDKLTVEAYWKAVEVIFNLENFAQLGFAVRQLMQKDTWPKVKARLLGGPVDATPEKEKSQSESASFSL